jgi:hypothetical protein
MSSSSRLGCAIEDAPAPAAEIVRGSARRARSAALIWVRDRAAPRAGCGAARSTAIASPLVRSPIVASAAGQNSRSAERSWFAWRRRAQIID